MSRVSGGRHARAARPPCLVGGRRVGGADGLARRAGHVVDGSGRRRWPRPAHHSGQGEVRHRPRRASREGRAYPGQVPARKIPAKDLPRVASATNAKKLDGQTATQLTGSCSPTTVDLGTWCLMAAPYPLTNADIGKNNYFWASQKCVSLGGYLPTAAQLIGAADRVKLESTINDSPLTATVEQDPSRGLQDQREMSATLVTTAGGSDAAGSEGVSVGSTGNPNEGQPNPTPEPAVPAARDAPVRDRLRQPRQGRVRRFGAGLPARELPLRIREDPGCRRARATASPGTPRPRRGRLVATVGLLLAIALATASCGTIARSPTVGAQPAPGSVVLRGAGARRAPRRSTRRSAADLAEQGITLNYQLSEPGAALAQFRAGRISFLSRPPASPVAGNLPRIGDDLGSVRAGRVHGRGGRSTTCPASTPQLKLSGATLAGMYLGTVRTWNSRADRP